MCGAHQTIGYALTLQFTQSSLYEAQQRTLPQGTCVFQDLCPHRSLTCCPRLGLDSFSSPSTPLNGDCLSGRLLSTRKNSEELAVRAMACMKGKEAWRMVHIDIVGAGGGRRGITGLKGHCIQPSHKKMISVSERGRHARTLATSCMENLRLRTGRSCSAAASSFASWVLVEP